MFAAVGQHPLRPKQICARSGFDASINISLGLLVLSSLCYMGSAAKLATLS